MANRNLSGTERTLFHLEHTADLAIIGGGLAGVCAAITAARMGVSVVLAQDRPVLGGNSSSEVRLWVLGATSHMGNNNRWAREGGVIDEILIENLWRNPEGNPILFDALLLEKVKAERGIHLLLNTAVLSLDTHPDGSIRLVEAFCSQNETSYTIEAKLFCDASGDGILGFLAGAPFRMGAETREEFDEGFAPSPEYGSLLGHSLYFYSRDTGQPVKFVPPAFAITDISDILRYRELKASDTGCRLWWLEYGGRLDTIHQTEEIKWELWKVAYGIWNHIKNSGDFPEAETFTLEWVGTIPGKRESRRFEGDYILTQRDVVCQTEHADAVSFGGWAMDLHPADGVYSKQPGCTQWHPRGIYQIPYRCLYSRSVSNLFLAGRIISVTHVAFGSTRVMATCAHNGQAVGAAAALCLHEGVLPCDLTEPTRMRTLQQALLNRGQFIPGLRARMPDDLALTATVTASSVLELADLPTALATVPLNVDRAMLLPLQPGKVPDFEVRLRSCTTTSLVAELWIADRQGTYTPDRRLHACAVSVPQGESLNIPLHFEAALEEARYVFLVLKANAAIKLFTSDDLVTGILALSRGMNAAVAKSSSQTPPEDIGVDAFDFWLPQRRPGGKNLSLGISPPLRSFAPENVINGLYRPFASANAWVASPRDAVPCLTLSWKQPVCIRKIILRFDTDFDHAMESVLMEHKERAMPFCVADYRLLDDAGNVVQAVVDNHQTQNEIVISQPLNTRQLHLEVHRTHGGYPAVFGINCFSEVA